MALKRTWPAHHFDFKKWLLWGHDKPDKEYPIEYPLPQDCYPDPENDTKDTGVNEYGC